MKALGQEKTGFHAFRRFRTAWVRKQRAPEDLIKFWLGHAMKDVTDGYSKVREDVEFRKAVASQIGLGFEISPLEVAPNAPKTELEAVEESVA